MDQALPFKPARLVDCGGDLSGRWYIVFYAWDAEKQALVRVREYLPADLTNGKARREYAEKQINTINHLLSEGYHRAGEKPQDDAEQRRRLRDEIYHPSIAEALTRAMDYKKAYVTHRTMNSYNNVVTRLRSWMKKKDLYGLPVNSFTKQYAAQFMAHLVTNIGISGTTHNNYLNYFKSIFAVMVDQGLLEENPFVGLKKLPQITPDVQLWDIESKVIISDYLKENDYQVFLAVLFVYHCFLRPKEIISLQLSDVDLPSGTVKVKGGASKNRKAVSVTLSNQLVHILGAYKDRYDDADYIFAHGGRPGAKPISRTNLLFRFKKAREACGLPDNLKLYSFKHTGNVEMMSKGATPEELRNQNRHHDISITGNYLRRVTKEANAKFRDLSGDL